MSRLIQFQSELASLGIQCQIASTPKDRELAFRLTYLSYLRAGLARINPHKIRVTPHQLLPSTTIFIAKKENKVISTLSLVADGDLGLPMEVIYPEQIEKRRQNKLYIGEVSALADRRKDIERFLPVFLTLSKHMVQFARYWGMKQILIVVNPRHISFYKKFLCFETIGDLRQYPTVCNQPAVPLCLDFDRIDAERPQNYDFFFGEEIDPETLQPHPLTQEEIERYNELARSYSSVPQTHLENQPLEQPTLAR